jgi:N-acetylmuramoyl-L-alanine amidase
MTFTREPVVAPALPTLTFGSKVIPSATYGENNGAAVITVNSGVPLAASVSRDGHTLTLSPTPAPAVTAQNPPLAGTPSPAPATPTTGTPAPAAPVTPRRYFAVVDASHGGEDRGETLSGTLLEKDITVALARSLRQELESRGIPTLVLRESDANLSLDQRAIFANTSHAAVYIALHATAGGRGVRLYTALLPYDGEDRGPFRAWTTSQHASLALSQVAAGAVAGELQKRQIPVRTLAAPLRPLNNVIVAALAVEIAPLSADISQVTAPDYQQLITSAIATAIAANREQLGATP